MKLCRDNYNQLIQQSFKEILNLMFPEKHFNTDIRIIEEYPAGESREVAIIIQFVGGIEGKIILVCSYKTAIKISGTLTNVDEEEPLTAETEKEYIKNSLGEVINIIAGKFAYGFQEDYGMTTISTPAIILGQDITVSVYEEAAVYTNIETQFGIFQFIISVL